MCEAKHKTASHTHTNNGVLAGILLLSTSIATQTHHNFVWYRLVDRFCNSDFPERDAIGSF